MEETTASHQVRKTTEIVTKFSITFLVSFLLVYAGLSFFGTFGPETPLFKRDIVLDRMPFAHGESFAFLNGKKIISKYSYEDRLVPKEFINNHFTKLKKSHIIRENPRNYWFLKSDPYGRAMGKGDFSGLMYLDRHQRYVTVVAFRLPDGGSSCCEFRSEENAKEFRSTVADEDGDMPGTDAAGVPRPPGGRRLFSLVRPMAGGGTRNSFVLIYETEYSPDRVRRFYIREMESRGWEYDEFQSRLREEESPGRSLDFTKESEARYLKVAINEDSDREVTEVTLIVR